MKTSIASVFVNFGAITTALLMSAVIMIYDQKQKTVFKISDIEENNKPRSNLIILNNNNICSVSYFFGCNTFSPRNPK